MTYYESALIFAVVAVVLVRLQEPGEILDWMPKWKLTSCSKCLAGQLSLWVMIGVGVWERMPFPYWVFSAVTVFLSIFFAIVISLILEKIEYGYS